MVLFRIFLLRCHGFRLLPRGGGGIVGWNCWSWLFKYDISGTLHLGGLFGFLPVWKIAVVACILVIDDESEPFFFHNTSIGLILLSQHPPLLILLPLSLRSLIIICNFDDSSGSAEILEKGGIMF